MAAGVSSYAYCPVARANEPDVSVSCEQNLLDKDEIVTTVVLLRWVYVKLFCLCVKSESLPHVVKQPDRAVFRNRYGCDMIADAAVQIVVAGFEVAEVVSVKPAQPVFSGEPQEFRRTFFYVEDGILGQPVFRGVKFGDDTHLSCCRKMEQKYEYQP
jgi:hypothetical protein